MTQSDSARVRVHAPEMASQRHPGPAGSVASRAREEYSPAGRARKAHPRRGASLHVVEIGDEAAAGWLLTEAPPAAGTMWRQVAPRPGEAPGKVAWVLMSTAGLFRAVAVTGLWVVALSVSTRTRAGVGLVLVVLVATAGLIIRSVNP